MQAYSRIEHGFCISLNLSLYARPAVMKALYRYHEQFTISFELEKDHMVVYFETPDGIVDIDGVVASILKELSFQMIRFDTMQATNHIRELLVARALYATCIEEDRGIQDKPEGTSSVSWEDDQRRIFSSWSTEQ